MKVSIVKYNAGNVYSVINALTRLGVDPILTDDAETLCGSDCVLFPGQGEARGAMDYLCRHRLDEVIRSLRQPVLGICIGQQLLCRPQLMASSRALWALYSRLNCSLSEVRAWLLN